MKKNGFTLTEILVVIAIISITAAICFPVYARARKAASITSSKGRLRQLWVATRLYQDENNASWSYGTIAEMSLPLVEPLSEWEGFRKRYGIIPLSKSPCGLSPGWFDHPVHTEYWFAPQRGFDPWPTYAAKNEGRSIMWADFNCDDHSVDVHNVLFVHYALGVVMDGNLVVKRKRGIPISLDWWAD